MLDLSELPQYSIPRRGRLKPSMMKTPVFCELPSAVQKYFLAYFLAARGVEHFPQGIARLVYQSILAYEADHPNASVVEMLRRAVNEHNKKHPDKQREYKLYAEVIIDAVVVPGNQEFYNQAIAAYRKSYPIQPC